MSYLLLYHPSLLPNNHSFNITCKFEDPGFCVVLLAAPSEPVNNSRCQQTYRQRINVKDSQDIYNYVRIFFAQATLHLRREPSHTERGNERINESRQSSQFLDLHVELRLEISHWCCNADLSIPKRKPQ